MATNKQRERALRNKVQEMAEEDDSVRRKHLKDIEDLKAKFKQQLDGKEKLFND